MGSLWMDFRTIVNQDVVRVLRLTLDAGEAEVIALALENCEIPVLLDERKARTTCKLLGIECLGTLDVLTQAKKRRIIESVQPLLDDLIKVARFRVSRKLYERVLNSVDEPMR